MADAQLTKEQEEFILNSLPGKETDPPKKNQSEDQEKEKTDGESSSVNGSLESVETDPPKITSVLETEKELAKVPSKETVVGPPPPPEAETALDEIEFKGVINEVLVTPDTKKGTASGEELINIISETNETSEAIPIAVEYFNLEEENGEYKIDIPQNILEEFGEEYTTTEQIPNQSAAGPAFIEREVTKYRVNDDAIKAALGPFKYEQWLDIQNKFRGMPESLGGGPVDATKPISEEVLIENFDLSQVDEGLKSNIVTSQKEYKADQYLKSLTDKERSNVMQFASDDVELTTSMQESLIRSRKDIRDFEKLFNRPLVRPETIRGRTYDPRPAQGDFTGAIRFEEKDLKKSDRRLRKESKKLEKQFSKLTKLANTFDRRITGLDNEIEKLAKQINLDVPIDAQVVAPDLFIRKQYNAKIEERNNLINSKKYQSLMLNWDNLTSQVKKIDQEAEKLNTRFSNVANSKVAQNSLLKCYDYTERAFIALEDSFIGSSTALVGQGADLLAETGIPTRYGFVDLPENFYNSLKDISRSAQNYNLRLSEKRQKILPIGAKYEDNRFQWILEHAVDATPTLLTIFIPGQVAKFGVKGIQGLNAAQKALAINRAMKKASLVSSGLFFLQESGGYISEQTVAKDEAGLRLSVLKEKLKDENLGAIDKQEINKQIDYEESVLNMSEGRRSLNAFAYGGIAFYAEKTFTLRWLNNTRNLTKGIGFNQYRKVMNPLVAKYAANLTSNVLRIPGGMGGELIEEGLTKIGQNLVDFSGGETKSAIDGIDEDFVRDVLLVSFILNGNAVGNNIYNSTKSLFLSKKNIAKHTALTNKALDIQERINGLKKVGSKNAENTISRLEFEKNTILKQLSLDDAGILINANKLSSEDFKELNEINESLSVLFSEAQNLGLGEQNESTRQELKELQNQAEELSNKKEQILQKPEQEIKEKAKDAKNSVEAEQQLSNYSYNKAIAESYLGKENVLVFKDASEIDDSNLSNDEKAELKEELEKGNNARFDGKKIVLFESNIENTINGIGGLDGNFSAAAPLHELGHQQIQNQGIIKNDELNGIGVDLVENLNNTIDNLLEEEKISEEEHSDIKARINAYNAEYKKKKKGEVDADELIQLVSDLQNTGIIPKKSFASVWQIKSFVNKAMQEITGDAKIFFKLNTFNDVSAFVQNWTKKVAEGTAQLPPEDETQEARASISQLNTKLEQDYDNNPRKLVNDMLTFPLQESAFAKEIGGITENITKRLYDPIPADQKQTLTRAEFKDALIGEAATLVTNEYKVGEQSLDKFVSTRLNLRANNLASRLGIEAAITEDVSERKDIQADDDIIEAIDRPVEEKPEFKRLTAYQGNQAFISEDAMPEVNTAVSRIVGAPSFTAKFDERAPDGKQTSNFIAALKKQFGNSILVDRIKAKSIVKSKTGTTAQAFERFMLQNKKAILENMTTTYLQTAFPHAVEKSVDGVFVRFPAWLGKKIDRETTGQGNDLVRRVPNIAQAVSDEQYLEDIRTNPLKDGKEVRLAAKQNSVLKAISEEIGIEMVVDAIKDPNSDIYKALVRRQGELGVTEEQITAVEAQVQAERGNVKFSIGSKGFTAKQLREFADAANFDVETAEGRGKLINLYYKKKGIPEIYKLDSETDINNYIAAVKKHILPLLPKSEFFSSDIDSGSSAFRRSSRFVGDKTLDDYFIAEINKLRALDKKAFGKEIPKLGKKPKGSYEAALGNNDQQFEQKSEDGSWSLFNDYHGKIHAEAWKRVDVLIKRAQELRQNEDTKQEGDDILKVLGNYFSIVSNDKSHWHKMGAQMVAWSPNAIGEQRTNKKTGKVTTKKYEWEHGVPATRSYIFLINASLDGVNFDLAYNAVQSQNKLIALDSALNKNLQESGLATKMTNKSEGWNFLRNDFFDRYAEAGINLDELMVNTKTSLAQAAGVSADGTRLTPRGIRFSQLVIQQNAKEAREKIKEIENTTASKLSKASIGNLSKEFNNILERKTGVESFKTFSAAQAQMRGAKKGKFKFFIAPAVEDFRGLVNYAFAGRGKQGEKDMAFLEEKLMTPYAKGIAAIDGVRQQIKRDFKSLVNAFPQQYKQLNKEIGNSGFTFDQAVRVYLWQKAGIEVPGLSKKDTKLLNDAIQGKPELIDFANSLLTVARRDQWTDPDAYWLAGTVLSDLSTMTEKVGRKEYLSEFIENADVIFSSENLNKIEALFGKAHREAIEDSLYSMKNGTNRQQGQSKIVGKWLNWLNGSTGAIMFFNRRSALLQMLSATNFINWSDNNILKAGAAFANQKQYWSDWSMIFNSDKLRERRGGLRQDVSANEIASVANESKNSPKAIIAYLLKLGFKPTQLADSFAIATGGAAFYRNRVDSYLKEGKTQKEAEEQAFIDFSKKSDEAQQSSDPALVSQVQRSVLGRLVFAFQNTPMQYARLMKKAALDLKNKRGDWKEHVSKIAYYGAIQNLIFSSLQSALFALIPGFDDEDEEELIDEALEKRNKQDEARIARVLNSMVDTILRGSGVYGAVFATIKNAIAEYDKQEEKGFMADHTYTVLSLTNISPPISSKLRKVYSSIQTGRFEKDEMSARGWAVSGEGRLDLGPNWSILGKLTSATLNLPLDRVVDELTSISEAFDARNTAYQRMALGLGWKTWDVGAEDELGEAIKTEARAKRKEEGKIKAAETRKRKAEEKKAIEDAKKPEQKAKEKADKKAKKENIRQKTIDDNSIVDSKKLFDLSKEQQKILLGEFGVYSKDFFNLKTEQQRVDKIIELRKSGKKRGKYNPPVIRFK